MSSSGPTKEEIRIVATDTLLAVAKNAKAPAAARAAAARTLFESIGLIGRLQELAHASEKQLTQMSSQEIEAEIARLKPKA